MHHSNSTRAFGLALLMAGLCSATSFGSALDSAAGLDYVDPPAPGEVIFKLTPDAMASDDFRADLGSQGRTGLDAVDQALASLAASEVRPVFNMAVNGDIKRERGMDRFFIASYSGSQSPEFAAAALDALFETEFGETNGTCRAMVSPNDTHYASQWAHDNFGQASRFGGGTVGTPDCDTNTDLAWDLQTGDPNLVVAVIDTGCDLNHPEYNGRLVQGYDFVNNDNNPSDDGNHGTSCAGIVLAEGNNGQGVAGVAWNVKLMPIKVLNSGGSGTWGDVAAGIEYAADNGARIQSISLGGSGGNNTLENACDYAVSFGCALFCASGNSGSSTMIYPAQYSNTIAVGACSPCFERKTTSSCDGENWWASSYGTGIDFLTPGTRIYTTDRLGGAGYSNGDYMATFNGTSSATPQAAGIGALVWSQDPTLTNEELRAVLQGACTDLGPNGYDNQHGHGLLRADLAVLAVTNTANGSCCYPGGNCQLTIEEDCATGVWSDSPCDPNPCPQPQRACCLGEDCMLMTQDDCRNAAGTWKMLETDCSGEPCFTADAPGENGLPSKARLLPTMPNPFHGETMLGYQLPAESEVTLRIYDVAGKVVRVLADRALKAGGTHEAVWNGRDDRGHEVPAGIYLYVLETEGTRVSSTITLMK